MKRGSIIWPGAAFGQGWRRAFDAGGDAVRRATAIVCLSAFLGGCYGWEMRHGIDPVLDPAAVELGASNQTRILNALALDAQVPLGTSDAWYEVTQAGFNYIDDQCRAYFNAIFFLNRDKDQIKTGLTAAGATTAAILGVTGASATSIAIVAQAFGLGVVGTEVVAGTYLYQMPPAVAQGFVKELQLAYRDGAASRRNSIRTASAAYGMIQGYLALCLPPTIEAKIAEHVAGARGVPDPTTGNGNTQFGITTVTPPPVTRAEIRQNIITNPDAPLPSQHVRPPRTGDTILDAYEGQISAKDIMKLQTLLCVTPDGKLGPLNSSTRLAINNYLASIPASESPPPTNQTISHRTWRFLVKLINSNKPFC